MRPALEDHGRRSRHREVARSSPHRAGSRREVESLLRQPRGLTWREGIRGPSGSRGPFRSASRLRATVRAAALEVVAGRRLRGVSGGDSRGGEAQESIGPSCGATRVGGERTRQGEGSFGVGEAGGTRRSRGSEPRVTGKRASARGKGAPSHSGDPGHCARARAFGETEGDKALGRASPHAGG